MAIKPIKLAFIKFFIMI